jgi:hypothetical protein
MNSQLLRDLRLSPNQYRWKSAVYGFAKIIIGLAACIILFWSILALLVNTPLGDTYANSDYTWGVNGVVETRCQGGYKFVVSDGGRYGGTSVTQMLDEKGHAIPCGK